MPSTAAVRERGRGHSRKQGKGGVRRGTVERKGVRKEVKDRGRMSKAHAIPVVRLFLCLMLKDQVISS